MRWIKFTKKIWMFDTLKELLLPQLPSQKIEHFKRFYEAYKNGACSFDKDCEITKFLEPSFTLFCQIVPPKDVPRRKFGTPEGRAVMIHAIAHIEYSAIDLALDAAYRFRGLPKEFYDDWLEVAHEEVEHFLMLNSLLEELGCKYGDFPVHAALFEASQKTQKLLERMAVVPRFLEANGLDNNATLVAKVSQFDDDIAKKMLEALEIILRDEIGHVKKGDKWFKYACAREGVSPDIYCEVVKKHYPNSIERNKELNISARLKAGFSQDEIECFLKKGN